MRFTKQQVNNKLEEQYRDFSKIEVILKKKICDLQECIDKKDNEIKHLKSMCLIFSFSMALIVIFIWGLYLGR